jgi:dihydroorotate dehydrogenase
MSLYTAIARPLLFRLRAETAHEAAMQMLSLAAGVFGGWAPPSPGRPVECFGLSFPNAVGLAAGMDKNATALAAWPLMGFGFVEVGTVTALGQPGNPRPRVFRIPSHGALINRMGFNNEGAAAVAARLRRARERGAWPRVPVGINLGKSRVTPLDEAPADYAQSFRQLRDLADYFVVNVSSPNTPGLRELQASGHLRDILRALAAENPAGKPVLVKIAPDLDDTALAEVAECGEEEGAAGWIATNTTLDHAGIPRGSDEEGGLSGEPLRERSTRVLGRLAALSRRPLVGVGGISAPGHAREKIQAGASLIQVYTGLVYEGSGLPRALAESLSDGTAAFQPAAPR